MKKRIKRKVSRRIFWKLMSTEPLTEFERKYLKLPKGFDNPKPKPKPIVINFEPKKVDDLTAQLQEEGSLVPPAEFVLSNTVVEPVKVSKWSKAKSRVKGWFGK